MEPTLEGLAKYAQEFQVRDETNVNYFQRQMAVVAITAQSKPGWRHWVGVERWQSDSFARVRARPVHSQLITQQASIHSFPFPAMRD